MRLLRIPNEYAFIGFLGSIDFITVAGITDGTVYCGTTFLLCAAIGTCYCRYVSPEASRRTDTEIFHRNLSNFGKGMFAGAGVAGLKQLTGYVVEQIYYSSLSS